MRNIKSMRHVYTLRHGLTEAVFTCELPSDAPYRDDEVAEVEVTITGADQSA
jgi:hypothetical protein